MFRLPGSIDSDVFFVNIDGFPDVSIQEHGIGWALFEAVGLHVSAENQLAFPLSVPWLNCRPGSCWLMLLPATDAV